MTEVATKIKATAVKTKITNMVVSTIMAMVSRFLELKSTTFIQIWQVTKTISRMKKTGNRFAGKIEKLNCLNCVTNYDYENMVNHARSKEAMKSLKSAMVAAGVPLDKIDAFFTTAKSDITENAESFKTAGLKWGKYVDNSKCVIIHTPKSKDNGGTSDFAGIEGHYLQVCVLNYADPVYRWIESGVELTEAELAEMKTFITPKKVEGARQGLANPKVIRSPRFETMERISLNKAHYQLNG